MNLKQSKAEFKERLGYILAPFQSCYFIGDSSICLWSRDDHRAIVDSNRNAIRKLAEELHFDLKDIHLNYEPDEGTRVFVYLKPRFCEVYPYKVLTPNPHNYEQRKHHRIHP